MILGVPKELVGAAIFGARLAHRLARRLPGAAPQADHAARPGHRSARRQAADLRGAHLARADRSRAGVDGGGDHRPRVRGDRRCAAWPTRAASRCRRRRSARSRWSRRWWRSCADPRRTGRCRGCSADRAGRAVGGGGRRRWCRRPTTSGASTRPQPARRDVPGRNGARSQGATKQPVSAAARQLT